MSIFNVPLAFNLTNNDPINTSPFIYGLPGGAGAFPPPGSDFMITEDGDFMLTEDGEFMITE